MSKTDLVLATVALVLVITAVSTALPAQTRPQSAVAEQSSDKYDGDCTGLETEGRCVDKPFTHEYCQYPTRTTNPPDGCDNSDPCDPSNAAHGGSGGCLPHSNTVEPETEPTTPVSDSNSLKQCGGK